jgi:hypothetical protein
LVFPVAQAPLALIDNQTFIIGLTIAFAVASLIAPVATLKVMYRYGGLNLHYHYATRLCRWAWDKYTGWVNAPSPSDGKAIAGIVSGALFMTALTKIHHLLPYFPFHPLGFAMADSLVIRKIWFSIFLGWLAKGLILRYGGRKSYQCLRPAFIGLVTGELTAPVPWLVVDGFFQRKGHDVFPGFPPL